MPESLPTTDTRRATQLTAEVDRIGSAVTPGWDVATAPDSFGRALLEIAGLLAEVTTTGLDDTAERDALAFADTLDIPPAAPQAASATFVLVPEESRSTPTPVPVRTQLGVSGEEEVVFETSRALRVSPCRIVDVVAVDPAGDRIERAPGRVVATEPAPAAVTRLRVATAAGAASTVLQVSPAPELEPGDQVRILGVAYRVAKVEQDLVALRDPLEVAVPARTEVERIEALESFSLRNLQKHAVHIGHESLFNLEQPARIEIVLTPSGLARRLAGLDLTYAMWGTHRDEDAPRWHELDLVGGSATTLTLRKTWPGSVDILEIEGRKNRWLRIVHPVPIATEGVSDPVDQVALRVSSETSASAPAPVGSTTVSQAFHNSLPLAVTGRFLPFGPTPARFDIFSLAAPEALSKPGAQVRLDIHLADASLLALTAPLDGETSAEGTTAYGIDAGGRLQSLTITSAADVTWRALPGQPTAGGPPVVLDGSAGLLAARSIGVSPYDTLVARERGGTLVHTFVNGVLGVTWLPIPADAGASLTVDDVALVPGVIANEPGPIRLVRVGKGVLRACALSVRGSAPGWVDVPSEVGAHPDLGQTVAMSGVQGRPARGGASQRTADLVLTATDGSAWLGRIGAASSGGGLGVTWRKLAKKGARVDVRPVATRHVLADESEWLWVAWVDDVLGVAAWTERLDGSHGAARDANAPTFTAAPGSSLRVAVQPWAPWATQPLTVAVGADGQGRRSVLAWVDRDSSVRADLPRDGSAAPPTDVIIVGPPKSQQPGRPLLVLPRTGEGLVVAPVDHDEGVARTVQLRDGLTIDHQSSTSHYVDLVGGQAPRVVELDTARISVGSDDRVYEVDGGLRGATSYRFLRRLGAASTKVTGLARANGELRLKAGDTVTRVGHRLVIDTTSAEVTAVDTIAEPGFKIVTLDPPLSGTVVDEAVEYTVTRVLASGTVAPKDRQTLVRFGSAVEAGDVVRFGDGAPDVLVVSADALSANGRWWRTGTAWTTVPQSGTAVVLGDATIGTWTDRVLERGYDNPELSWEFFDGHGWRRLEDGFVDGTRELATSGTIEFRVPAALAPTEIGGSEDRWIRARLVGGDYGRPKYVVTTHKDGDTSTQTVDVDTSEMHPPEIVSIDASFLLVDEVAPESVLVGDNLATLDQTQASAADHARFPLFSGARAVDPAVTGPALYVGLTRAPVSPLSLLAVVDEQDAETCLTAELLTAAGWRLASVDDETAGLHRTGLVQVLASTPPVRAARFGRDAFWLRLRCAPPPSGGWRPVVRGLYVNAVPAQQARTIVQEILGSSLGEPALVVELAERPVLPDTVELRVREELGQDELDALEADLRRSALRAGRSPSQGPQATEKFEDDTWVSWRRVDSFVGTDGDARVYRLEPGTGRVTFGDGRQGKVPPAGVDAIRAFRYQQGGGAEGNAPAWSDAAVKSALEGIETVILPVDAAGGVAGPEPTALLVTAPARLRSAGRALTSADHEALAVAAAAQIVRARCTPPAQAGDPVVVAIATRDGTRRPVPSLALRDAVARKLRAAGWGGLSARRLRVVPPTYVPVAVSVTLRVHPDLAAQVEQTATDALVALLHPTEGGPGGSDGWPFGRRLWESDVLRTLQGIDGIDRVVDVEIRPADGARELGPMAPDGLVCAAESDVAVHVESVVAP